MQPSTGLPVAGRRAEGRAGNGAKEGRMPNGWLVGGGWGQAGRGYGGEGAGACAARCRGRGRPWGAPSRAGARSFPGPSLPPCPAPTASRPGPRCSAGQALSRHRKAACGGRRRACAPLIPCRRSQQGPASPTFVDGVYAHVARLVEARPAALAKPRNVVFRRGAPRPLQRRRLLWQHACERGARHALAGLRLGCLPDCRDDGLDAVLLDGRVAVRLGAAHYAALEDQLALARAPAPGRGGRGGGGVRHVEAEHGGTQAAARAAAGARGADGGRGRGRWGVGLWAEGRRGEEGRDGGAAAGGGDAGRARQVLLEPEGNGRWGGGRRERRGRSRG
jgi:hypothetical protein